MGAHNYEQLKEHIGHEIVCVCYGKNNHPENVAIECNTCQVVILDFNRVSEEDPCIRKGIKCEIMEQGTFDSEASCWNCFHGATQGMDNRRDNYREEV